jgi:beta-glucosidase
MSRTILVWRAGAVALALAFVSLPLSLARAGDRERDDCTAVPEAPHYDDWPRIHSALRKDPAQEEWIARVVKGMTLAQKVGQMTQPEAANLTDDDVRQYYIGSVLSGGNDWPAGKLASPADWLVVADGYWEGSMSTDLAVKIPIMYGVDAVHGNQKQFGATLFPHHVGQGAAHDSCLTRRIAAFTAQQMRVSGFDYAFGPCVTVPQDVRWGRTYEGYSENPSLTRVLGAAETQGFMSIDPDGHSFRGIVTTSKHFIGDGGTSRGVDQGVTMANEPELINIHGQGYFASLDAGAQTVMASYNSWDSVDGNHEEGKVHGSHYLLTTVLKEKLGFDGIVISDYNGIGQVTGCTNTRCAQAINAGIDLFMVPSEWKQFIADTVDLVNTGQVPMSRIDDAVTRILRVKLRAGLFSLPKPSARLHAGDGSLLVNAALGREAARKSLVLLKNERGVLPLARTARILLVGKSGDSIRNQVGGWSLGWQNYPPFDFNTNASFSGESLLQALREVVGAAHVTFSETAEGVNPKDYDAVIAAIGEHPYAEFIGDVIWNPLYNWGPTGGAIPPGYEAQQTLENAVRNPEDLAVLQKVSGQGVPVITLFISGRPLYTNKELNRSDAFVAAWLPGTEAGGITDVLFRDARGRIASDFQGRLPYYWPASACQVPRQVAHVGQPGNAPLFPYGYGLGYARPSHVPTLPEPSGPPTGCPN